MFRSALGFLFVCGILMACKDGEKKKDESENKGPSQGMASMFREGKLPYQLTDTGLLKNNDTTTLYASVISPLVADSIKTGYFGKSTAIKYTPLVRLAGKANETYYVIKATAGSKKGAMLLVFDDKNQFGASYPLLLPDSDPNTTQVSTIDKNLTVTKSIIQRDGVEIVGEGKEVYGYDASARSFSLIMTDALDDNPDELRNPIDTFPQTHKLAGDYFINKKNIISVRDGRYPNQLLVYLHTENKAGDCIGQLKGEFILTSSTTATFRQAGDPCVLSLTFKGNTVSMSEETGCGNYRGLDCPFTGTFTKKKPQSAKSNSAKPKRK